MQTQAPRLSDLLAVNGGCESASTARRVATQLLGFTVRQSTRNSYTVWLISFFVALATWGQVPPWLSMGWVLSVGIAYTVRVFLIRGAADGRALETAHDFWLRRYTTTTIACALVVAAGPALLFPPVTEAARMYMSILLCCWLAGSMASVGAYAGLLTPKTPILVYCGGADCADALELAVKLRELGFQDLTLYPGGYAEWTEYGGAVRAGSEP